MSTLARSQDINNTASTQTNVWAVVPVKLWLHSKMRLSGVLTQQQRIDLSRAMLCDLLSALSASKKIKHILLVGHAQQLRQLSTQFNISILDETLFSNSDLLADNKNQASLIKQYLNQNNESLNLVALQGFLFAKQQGAEQICTIHADLPWLNSRQVDSLITQINNKQQVILLTDRKSQGTNLIILNSQQQPKFLFGLMSCEKHYQYYSQLKYTVSILNLKNTNQDIDTAEDFFNLQSQINYAINHGLDYPQYCAQFFQHYVPAAQFNTKASLFTVVAQAPNKQIVFNKPCLANNSLKKNSFNSAVISTPDKQPQL